MKNLINTREICESIEESMNLDSAEWIDIRGMNADAAASQMLAWFDIKPSSDFTTLDDSSRFVMLAELANMLAKVSDEYWYYAKTLFGGAAVKAGATWWCHNGVFYMYTPEAGTASFHDPYGDMEEEIGVAVKASGNTEATDFSERVGWCRVRRQFHADDIVRSKMIRQAYAWLTRPRVSDVWMGHPETSRLLEIVDEEIVHDFW